MIKLDSGPKHAVSPRTSVSRIPGAADAEAFDGAAHIVIRSERQTVLLAMHQGTRLAGKPHAAVAAPVAAQGAKLLRQTCSCTL